MKKLLVIVSSVRENRAADNILKIVHSELSLNGDFEVSVADLKSLPMPFINTPQIPASKGFEAQDANVNTFLDMLNDADAVMVLTPEYNHSYPAQLKNAIDWGFQPWHGKPVSLVGYGWAGGARATNHLRDVFNSNLSASITDQDALLRFKTEIDVDGTELEGGEARQAIRTALNALQDSLEPVALKI